MAKKKNSQSKASSKKTTKKLTKKTTRSKKSAAKKTAKKTQKKAAKKSAGKTVKKTVTRKSTSAKKVSKKKAAATQAKTTGKKTTGTTKSKPAANMPAMHGRSEPSHVDLMVREGELDEAILLKKKSGLKKKELLEFRRLLLEKRAEIVGDVASLQSSRGDGGDLSHMPVHMADVGSDNYEQEFTLGLMESERKLLTEIDEALMRISKGYFGICLITGEPIERPRLEIKPWAKYCIAVVRSRERMGYR